MALDEDKEAEFDAHVWDHTGDVFLRSFQEPRAISTDENALLAEMLRVLRTHDDQAACDRLYRLLADQDPKNSIIPRILQLVGSTRNQILTDLRATLSRTDARVPSRPQDLHKNDDLLRRGEQYIAAEMRRVFAPVLDKSCELDDGALRVLFETLNRATWPGFKRQERAKMTGHYAEFRIASMLADLGISFEPASKLENRPSQDVVFEGMSYDIVVPDSKKPRICIKATTHTSNIGQYGESKDALEIKYAKSSISALDPARRPILVSFIDGVGLRSNRRGLRTVLGEADEFFQFASMWKLPVMAAYKLGLEARLWLPDAEDHAPFLDRYSGAVRMQDSATGLAEAGEGAVLVVRRQGRTGCKLPGRPESGGVRKDAAARPGTRDAGGTAGDQG